MITKHLLKQTNSRIPNFPWSPLAHALAKQAAAQLMRQGYDDKQFENSDLNIG